jgi:hypothetical protein
MSELIRKDFLSIGVGGAGGAGGEIEAKLEVIHQKKP